MAFSSPLLFLLLLLLFASAANSATDSYESEDMLQSLRNYGYTLFTNAISTSDLKYQLLISYSSAAAATHSNFTIFAPRDELLYALDMAADASVYVSTLRYHVIPHHRHTFADLKNLSVPFLDTLLPHYAVLIGKIRDIDASSDRPSIAIVVDGVRVSFPDLYVGSRIAVHGIDGILLTGLNMSLDLRDDIDSDHLPPPANHASSAIQYTRSNNVSAPDPGSGALSVSVAPASSDGDIAPNPNAPTPVPYTVDEQTPVEGTTTGRNDDAAPPEKGLSTPPSSQIDRNDNAAPPEKEVSTAPSSQIDGSDVEAAPAPRVPATPTSPSDNISAAAAPTISQDETEREKLKRLGGKRKHKGKTHRKERRRHRHRALDL